jgi:hypothetical protein
MFVPLPPNPVSKRMQDQILSIEIRLLAMLAHCRGIGFAEKVYPLFELATRVDIYFAP